MASAKEIIAYRVAQDLKDGDVVNLGIGLPTQVANYIPEGVEIALQSENGIIGMAGVAAPGEVDPDVTNAGGTNVTVNPGAAFFDSATSFGIIRGGGDARFTMYMNIISTWCIVMPLSFMSAFWWRWPVVAVVMVIQSDQIFKGLPTFLRFRRYRWIKKLTREEG